MSHRTRLLALVIVQALLLYLTASSLASDGTLYACRLLCGVSFSTWGAGRIVLVPLIVSILGIVAFVLPIAIGALCRTWQGAVVFAVAPWCAAAVAHAGTLLKSYIGLGQTGGRFDSPFWLDPSLLAVLLGSLILFAALGGLGWLARQAARSELSEPS